MVSKGRGVLVALIIGSIIGGTASVTILDAAQASQSSHERAETAQVQTYEHAFNHAN
jgi:uncharacterized protein YceK